MEVHNPTNTRNMALIGTCANPKDNAPASEVFNTGNAICDADGNIIASVTNNNANPEPNVSIVLLDTLLPRDAPNKRPMSIRNQYVPATKPAVVAPTVETSASESHKFNVAGVPTSTPTYTKMPTAAKMKCRNFIAPFIKQPRASEARSA